MSRKLRPLVAIALVSLISAGCGFTAPSETGGANSTGTANSTGAAGSSGAAGGSGTGATNTATDQDKLVKFAECIRGHGVPDFPDANAKGEFVFGINVSPAVWTNAVDACKALQPPGTLSSKRRPEQQTAALRFAQCVRENGVKDFPDPANGEPLIDTTRIPSTDRNGGMTILNAATRTCRGLLAEAAAGQ